MTWKANYYGQPRPSLIKKIAEYSLLLTALSMPLALWFDFVPNNKTERIGFTCALIFSVALSGIIYYELIKRPTQKFIQYSFIKKLLFLLLFPILPLVFSWFFFVHSLPALFTLVLGQPYKVQETVRKVHTNSRRTCDHRIEFESLSNAVPDFICISEDFYNNASNEVLLVGKQSVAGEYYESVYRK